MLRSLFSAVSGLQAHQEMMDVIGNNIANINTDGFKSDSTVFQDLLSQTLSGAGSPTAGLGGIDPAQVGLGVKVVGTQTDFTQGATEQTGRNLDVSVAGDGFMITNSAANGTAYTRAGNLNVDANGNLVDPNGNLIQGWQADGNGNVNTNNPLGNLKLTVGSAIAATPTGQANGGANAITLTGNVGTTIPIINGAAATANTVVTVYDNLGNADKLNLTFVPSGFSAATGGTETVSAVLTLPTGATMNVNVNGGATGSLTFLANGNLSPTSTLTINTDNTEGFPGALQVNLAGVTATALGQNATPSLANKQNGFAAGTLQTFTISPGGVINGVYSNGLTQAAGQLALANFANPGGLVSSGDNSYQATANSGVPQVGAAGNGGRGLFSPGTVEMSNVDLSVQFTKLIEAQRGFEANGKVVTTSDQLLQALLALKN